MVSRFTKHLRTLSTKKSMKSSIIAITEDGATAAGVSCTPPSIRRKLSTKISARSKNQDKTRSVLNLMTRILYLESLSRRYTSCSPFYKQGCLHRIDFFFRRSLQCHIRPLPTSEISSPRRSENIASKNW